MSPRGSSRARIAQSRSSKCRPVERRSQIVEAPQSRARDGDVALRVRRGIQPFAQSEPSLIARSRNRRGLLGALGAHRLPINTRVKNAGESSRARWKISYSPRQSRLENGNRTPGPTWRSWNRPTPHASSAVTAGTDLDSRICSGIRNPPRPTAKHFEDIGAGEGNRTLVFSLEGCCSTIELHPRFQ